MTDGGDRPDAGDGGPASGAAESGARDWMRILAVYRGAHHGRSAGELAITIAPLVLLWIAMRVALDYSYWLSLALAFPAAGFLVRLFMIQHDCGHGAFFRRRSLNDWVGRAIGVLTLTPYDFWRRTHNMHHAGSGNLARRGIGDIQTLTVHEYVALPWWRRLAYRLYRHPAVMFGVAPAYLFILQYRLPVGLMRECRHRRRRSRRDLAGRPRAVPAHPSADHADRRLDRGLAVLRPAPVRGHGMGGSRRLEPARGRSARQLTLRPAARAALVHRQHRHSPRPPPVQPDTVLPAAAGAQGSPQARRDRPAVVDRKPRVRATGAVGRCRAAADFIPRDAPATGRGRLRDGFGATGRPVSRPVPSRGGCHLPRSAAGSRPPTRA
jgi:hypothetical protein